MKRDYYAEWLEYTEVAKDKIIKVARRLEDGTLTYADAWTIISSDHNLYDSLLDMVQKQIREQEIKNEIENFKIEEV